MIDKAISQIFAALVIFLAVLAFRIGAGTIAAGAKEEETGKAVVVIVFGLMAICLALLFGWLGIKLIGG